MNLDKYLKISQDTYSKIAETYGDEMLDIVENDFFQRVLPLIPKNGKILDVGCGSGWEANFFHSKGFNVVGIDKNKRMIEVAKKRVKAKFYEMDALKMNFKNEFDVLFSAYVLSDIPKTKLKSLVSRFYHALRPNGILCIITEYGEGISFRKYDKSFLGNPMFYNFYTKRYLEKLIRERFKILHSSIEKDVEKVRVNLIISKKK